MYPKEARKLKAKYQVTLDTVLTHILKQDAQCADSEEQQCYYRYHGMKCAIGALIPDALYDPRMDESTLGVVELFKAYPEVKEYFEIAYVADEDFLFAIQRAHDKYEPRMEDAGTDFIDFVVPRLRELAEDNELVFNG